MANITLTAAPSAPLDQVQWKVDSRAAGSKRSPTGWVARFVPYIDAATVAALLDEWVGASHWWDDYQTVEVPSRDGKVLLMQQCQLTIRVPDGADWREVTKIDVGAPPGGGHETGGKGARSDAFKRAATLKWGVGRNVYTLPNVWAPVDVPKADEPQRCYALRDGTTEDAIRQQLANQGIHDAGTAPSPDEHDGPTDDEAAS